MKVQNAVIPVAGLGTRFLPATKAVPKEMLCVVDRPVVQPKVIERPRLAGFLAEMISMASSKKNEYLVRDRVGSVKA